MALFPAVAYLQPPALAAPTLPPGVDLLLQAYPRHLKGYADNRIIWKDGTTMQYDDGLLKTEDQTFDSTDLEDQINGLLYTCLLYTSDAADE